MSKLNMENRSRDVLCYSIQGIQREEPNSFHYFKTSDVTNERNKQKEKTKFQDCQSISDNMLHCDNS